MSTPQTTLRLVADNPEPTPEAWADRPRNTLLTFTLPRQDIDGAYYGVKNLLWANARMMAALDAWKAGDEAEAQKNIDRAIVEMTSANAFAEKLYAIVKQTARRTNRMGGRS